MAGNKLDTLAQELFENVIQSLRLKDLRSLRLVSFAVANKTDSRVFKAFLRKKHVTDSRSDLEEFVHMTSAGRRSGCLVQDLTYVSTVYYMRNLEVSMVDGQVVSLNEEELDRDDMLKTGEDVKLIAQGLCNIFAATGRGLDKLSLRVGIRYGAAHSADDNCDNTLRFLYAAMCGFRTVTSALRKSGIRIANLDLYTHKGASISCGIPCDQFANVDLDHPSLKRSLGKVKVLSLRVANSTLFWDFTAAKVLTKPQQLSRLEGDSTSLRLTLQTCTRLEELDLSWYEHAPHYRVADSLLPMTRSQITQQLAQLQGLPRLRKLRLAGLEFDEIDDLACLLCNLKASLQELALVEIRTSEKAFRELFSYLASDECQVRTFHAADLMEAAPRSMYESQTSYYLLSFRDERHAYFTAVSGVYNGANIIDRWGEDMKKQITYHFQRYRHRTREIEEWKEKRLAEFGGGETRMRYR